MAGRGFKNNPAARRRLVDLLWPAQDKRCFVCGGLLFQALRHRHPEPIAWTVDHVWPRCRFRYVSRGNLAIAHRACNSRKGDRLPTGCELVLLEMINARCGFELSPC